MLDVGDLPEEVFCDILSYLPRNNLASFALVSKSWYTKATPLLYRDIDLVWRHAKIYCCDGWKNRHANLCPCEELGYCKPELHKEPASVHWNHRRHRTQNATPCIKRFPCNDKDFPPLYLLVRTMISTPSLADLVFRLRLTGLVPHSVWTQPSQTELSHDDRCHVQTLLRSSSHDQQGPLITELDRGSPGAFAALLLMCLSNLRQLELGADFHRALHFMSVVPSITERFTQLNAASIGSFREGVNMGSGRAPLTRTADLDQLLFFYIPAIRQLSLNIPNPMRNANFGWPKGRQAPLATSLETLELAYTYMDENGLSILLEACPGLRTLKYDYWTTAPGVDSFDDLNDPCNPVDIVAEPLVNFSVLARALSTVKGTLETFHMHIQRPYACFNQNLRRIFFSDFSCLTTLHVPLQMLLGTDRKEKLSCALPKSLVHLWLNDDGLPLWLNHTRFESPQDFTGDDWSPPDLDPQFPNGIYEQQSHPIHTDDEVISVITEYLAEHRKVTPFLRTVKLLFYRYHSRCWEERNVRLLTDSLESYGHEAGVDVSVILLPDRSYYWESLERTCRAGQGPPYFDLNVLKTMRLHKGQPDI